MNITTSLSNMYWILGTLSGACLVGLAAGFSMTLGTGRKIGLPLIAGCAAILAASCVCLVILLLH